MKSLLTLYLLALFGCSPPKEHSEASDTSQNEASSEATLDYDGLMADLRRINYDKNGYKVFQAEWVHLRAQLQSASENGAINRLPEDMRARLWREIEYLRSCAHAEIFNDHNEEIIPILFSFDLPELNRQLREILVDSGQI